MLTASVAAPASAGALFGLDSYVGPGTPPAGPFGEIELTQDGANVDVLAKLAAGDGFVKTGAGDALMFELGGVSSIAIAGLSTGFSLESVNSGALHSSGAGSWDYGIHCDWCGANGTYPLGGPLSFTVEGVTVADFIQNGSGDFFGADLCLGITARGCGATGIAVAKTDPPTAAPEPASVAMFCAGLLGLGATRRLRRKAIRA
jgi:hypothetical protein